MRRFRLEHWLKTSLWVVPVLFILGGIALSLITTSIDDGDMIPESVTGDTTAAMQILYLIAFAMLTLTGLVLSLLVLVVQLAMGSFSPRIVRQILQDRPSQVALGLFAGTFSHALPSMRAIRTTPDGGTVPGLAVLIAIVLVLSCIATLVWYLNHIGQSLRAAALVGWVAHDTLKTLDRVYPGSGTAADPDPGFVSAPHGGVVFTIDHDRLILLATKADCRFELLWAVGDFVPKGASIVRIVGDPSGISHRAVSRAIVTGPERTMNQDVAYGLRMLVDIAEHSLSGGPLDDPTTAVQSIDRIHDILRQIAQRPLHDGRYEDRDGTLRLTVPTMHWEGYVRPRSTRSGRPARDHPRSSGACGQRWRICSPSRSPSGERRSSTSWPC
ncbi:DUF2254 domain-containing protein [Arthrobacter sp. SX1312]|uniref:DUF2254 domain-containing protein n=1 Tax=Arthrobacter sp. SX1312 TaxID=2058896 RepID=UPI000CE365CF|nr:DUF2254 domain-containing protein [Arthrobacter sp. SX1312]